MAENKNLDDVALANAGRIIYCVDELNRGDVLGIVHRRDEWGKPEFRDTRLYYVDGVDPEPHLKGMTLWPTAYLKPPHLGIRFSDSLAVCYAYIHIPSPGDTFKGTWVPAVNPAVKNGVDKETMEELNGKECGNAYLIREGLLYELGQLIPSVELPLYWNFMLQSNSPSEIKSVCEVVKSEIENARVINSKIKQVFKEHQKKASDRMKKEREHG